MTDQKADGDWVQDARDEVAGIIRDGMAHPATRPVLAGAALGAVAGAVLPLVSWPLGLAAGAGYMLYKRIRP